MLQSLYLRKQGIFNGATWLVCYHYKKASVCLHGSSSNYTSLNSSMLECNLLYTGLHVWLCFSTAPLVDLGYVVYFSGFGLCSTFG